MAGRPKKFTPEVQGAVLGRLAAGATLPDACAAVGINLRTVRTWVSKGNKAEHGPYADFARRYEEVREAAAAIPDPLTEEEYRRHLDKRVRDGNVQAMKLWWQVHLAGHEPGEGEADEDPLAGVDELARRRLRGRR